MSSPVLFIILIGMIFIISVDYVTKPLETNPMVVNKHHIYKNNPSDSCHH